VTVEVRAAGLCHSDLYLMDGAAFTSTTGAKLAFDPPLTLGHEIAGEIAEVGDGVSGWSRGDRVVSAQDPSNARFGSPGNTFDGGIAQFCALPAARLVRIPDDVRDDLAAVATDSINTAFYAVKYSGALQLGERVGIVGLGGLGINALRTAVLLGGQVYGVDINPQGFGLARDAGATECLTDAAALQAVAPALVVDFVGSSDSVAASLESVALGGRVVVVGLASKQVRIDCYDLILGRKSLRGSHGGNFESMSEVFTFASEGKLGSELVHVPFEAVDRAYADLRAGTVGPRRLVTSP
jgi:propanol-preferring alcohol dehydrogenase